MIGNLFNRLLKWETKTTTVCHEQRLYPSPWHLWAPTTFKLQTTLIIFFDVKCFRNWKIMVIRSMRSEQQQSGAIWIQRSYFAGPGKYMKHCKSSKDWMIMIPNFLSYRIILWWIIKSPRWSRLMGIFVLWGLQTRWSMRKLQTTTVALFRRCVPEVLLGRTGRVFIWRRELRWIWRIWGDILQISTMHHMDRFFMQLQMRISMIRLG